MRKGSIYRYNLSLLSARAGRESRIKAKVAELVDALALGASGATRESSSLSFRTNQAISLSIELRFGKVLEFSNYLEYLR